MNAAQPSKTDMAVQFEVVRQLIARGYDVSAYGPRGEVVLARGEEYRPGPLAYVLTVLTLGVWLLVIAGRSALQRREVATVWPDGSVGNGAVETSGSTATIAGVILIGGIGAAAAAVFSPLVALVGVPLAVVLVGELLSRERQ